MAYFLFLRPLRFDDRVAPLIKKKNGRNMNKSKTSISKAQSYKEIGEYWDKHEIAENWEETKPAEFEIDIKPKLHMHYTEST